jgi:ABC-2 type transport system permease protein
MVIFFGRAFMHIFDGMLGVFIGLGWGILLFGLDLSMTDPVLLVLTIFITTFSTASLGLLMGCLGLITRNVMLVNNTVYFLLLLFSGANIEINTLPSWMQAVSRFLPLTRGIESTRAIIQGGRLTDILLVLGEEIFIGIVFLVLGFSLFRIFETQAKKMGTLEIF